MEIVAAIEEMGLQSMWDVTKDAQISCSNGSTIGFYGLEGQKGLRALSGIDGAWLEEAQYLVNTEKDNDFRELMNTIVRAGDFRLYICGNPQFLTDPAYEWSLANRDRAHVCWLYTDYRDNPYLGEDIKVQIEHDRLHDNDWYLHDWLGQPLRTTDALRVLSPIWIEAARKLYAEKRSMLEAWPRGDFGLDPADGVRDECVLGESRGPFWERMWMLTQPRGRLGNALEMVDEAIVGADGRRLYYDDGLTVGSDVSQWYLDRKPGYGVVPVPFGGASLGPKTLYGRMPNSRIFGFQNVQMGWNLRDGFRASWRLDQGDDVPLERCIFVSPEAVEAVGERKFVDQLVQVEWKRMEGNRIRIEKAPRGQVSPDVFDVGSLCYLGGSKEV